MLLFQKGGALFGVAHVGGEHGSKDLQVGLGAVQAGDVDEGLVVGAVAMSAAAEVVGRTLTATSGGQIGMGIVASGGGFAGVIMAMIPNDLVDEYTEYIENAIGEGNVYRMSIRPHGAICVSERI